MINFSQAKVFVAAKPTDMRKSFRGLIALTRNHLIKEPRSGCFYVFTNRRRNLAKILCWDGSGYWLLCKKLEHGKFRWPEPTHDMDSVMISGEQLNWLLAGLDWRSLSRSNQRRAPDFKTRFQ